MRDAVSSSDSLPELSIAEKARYSRHLVMPEVGLEGQRRFAELDRQGDIIVYCHTGERSANATMFLKRSGFSRVRNLKGGIKARAEQVDPELPQY